MWLRQRVCKWFNLVPKENYISLYQHYMAQRGDIQRAIKIHGMQAAWQEAQAYHKRVH